jgi:hypothetical protein
MYSPIQMAADLPKSMKSTQMFSAIKDVAADWDESIPSSRTGDYITIARKAKGKESWFLGAITDEN